MWSVTRVILLATAVAAANVACLCSHADAARPGSGDDDSLALISELSDDGHQVQIEELSFVDADDGCFEIDESENLAGGSDHHGFDSHFRMRDDL